MNAHLRHDLQLLLQSMLEGKLPRNLSWSDVLELIRHIGEVQPHGEDEFAFVVGTQRAFFKPPHGKDLDMEEVSRLRKFLHQAGLQASAAKPRVPGRVLVVIDHHAAHVYKNVDGARPKNETTVKPYDPFGFHHHLIHRKEAHYEGERVPEESSFYDEIAKDLATANEIVVVGHATGKSNAANFLLEYLKAHHPAVAQHVVATETEDLSALTEPEIEQLVQKHMSAQS